MKTLGMKRTSVISDQGPENPKLGNRRPSSRIPPTSGTMNYDQANRDWDFYRDPDQNGFTPNANGQINPTITPGRLLQSVRMRWNPIRGLTTDRLTTYLDQWRLGFFRQAGMTWDTMERRDYQLRIDAPKRKKAVARHGYDVLTVAEIPDGMDDLAKQQQEFLKYFWDHITVTDVLNPDEKGGLALLTRQMLDALGKYYAVHELVWRPDGENLTCDFIFCPIWWFEGTRGKLRFLDSEFQVYGRDIYPNEWLVTTGDGLMESCSILYLFKWLDFKSWIAFLDKFASPGLLMKTSAQIGSPEWNQAILALQEFSNNYAAVVNQQCELNLVEAKSTGGTGGLFDTLLSKIDMAITQLWRGADLGTTSQPNATGSNRQQGESEILETDDPKMLEERLATGVSRYALAWKFGEDVPVLAYLKLRTAPKQATAIDIQVDQFLLTSGVPLGVDSTRERYARPAPKEGEELLIPPPSPLDIAKAKSSDKPDEGAFANTKLSPKFLSTALADFSKAASEDLKPIADRLKRILSIQNDAIFARRLKQFANDLPKMAKGLGKDSEAAKSLQESIAAAMVNGLAERKA